MMNHHRPTNAEPDDDDRVAEVERDIEETREALGETVDALAAKLDVKSQARATVGKVEHKLADTASAVRGRVPSGMGAAPFGIASVVLAAVAVIMWRRSSR